MQIEFVDMQESDNPLNGKVIHSRQEVLELLEQLRQRKPFGLELIGENGFTLTICLAEAFGAIQLAANNGEPPYLLAVAPGSPPLPPRGRVSAHSLALRADSDNGVASPDFFVGGTATPMATRYILSRDLVREIAAHFVETGERKPDVVWEEN